MLLGLKGHGVKALDDDTSSKEKDQGLYQTGVARDSTQATEVPLIATSSALHSTALKIDQNLSRKGELIKKEQCLRKEEEEKKKINLRLVEVTSH